VPRTEKTRIVLIEHPIKTAGDANWEYRVIDRNAPKGNRIKVLGARCSAPEALQAALMYVRGHPVINYRPWP